MIEEWDGKLDLRPLVEQWVSELPGDYDIDKCMADVRELYASSNSAVLVLMDGKPVGGLAISLLDIFFEQETYAAVRYWYIIPRYRSKAKSLIQRAMIWTLAHDCHKIMVCSSTLSHPAADFYKLMGFTEFETVYIGDI